MNSKHRLAELRKALADVIPEAKLETATLPGGGGLVLTLLQESYPQHLLDSDALLRIMNEPLYWAFCWAAGQTLAQFLLEHPDYVEGRRVLDFGAGSGVVAMAAARAGAGSVVVCDSDTLAQKACLLNADLNSVDIEVIGQLSELSGAVDIVLAADVLYDRSNLHWLAHFFQLAPLVLLADSRMKDFACEGYRLLERRISHTLPDLDESEVFRAVSVYLGQRSADQQGTV